MNSQDAKGGAKPIEQKPVESPLERYSVQPKQDQGQGGDKSPYYKSQAPTIELPKGGGALKGIDEKFTVNAVNGTAGLQVNLPLSPGRAGFTPSLSLSYNSGSGNGEFGLGWSLSLPSIQRKTDKKLPEYNDRVESDVFLLAGSEDLVPILDEDGVPDIDDSTSPYLIKRYIPRIEGLFARIEHIHDPAVDGSWWRVTTKDNITTWYGLTEDGRIADPDNANRIFKWLPQVTTDYKGNVQLYEYKREDSDNVAMAPHEKNRLSNQFAQRYLKNVLYCNNNPFTASDPYAPELPSSMDWLMSAVLDYGEHADDYPQFNPEVDREWACRKDPFSDFHAGFELRTYRKCKRVIMFHHFKELYDSGNFDPKLVRSLDIVYEHDGGSDYIEADFISSIKQTGYNYVSSTWRKRSLPAMVMEYQPLSWDTTMHNVTKQNFENAPQGLTGSYQWIDMEGEGLPGILTEQGNGWFYKNNLGSGSFAPTKQVAKKPSFVGLGNQLLWQDLEADGRRQLVSQNAPLAGYFELDDDQQWQPFRSFKEYANVDWRSPYTKVLDLNGDGRPDVLLTEDRAWRWYENKGTDGYAIGGEASKVHDEEKGPRILLNDMMQVIFLADINGDGMTDIARITNGEVCYWPNMGYGRFGAKVTMTDSPTFDRPELFNSTYITLSDISGTGAPDIIYLGQNKCTAWINLAGNAWSSPTVISPLPGIDPYSKIAVMDFLGNGTACIVWSSPLPQHAYAPMRYMDLMGGVKPYIMTKYHNGLGKSVLVSYTSSTQFYLEDKAIGTPWATRLPFPVQCVSQIITSDVVSQTQYSQSYTYHHGYYDHEEREFRGFGRVDSTDTDTAVINSLDDLDQAPVLTKSWFHTGAWLREKTLLNAFADEYYPLSVTLPDGITSIPADLTPQELREAHRAFKGQPLRTEVYALDGTGLQDVPYTVTSFTYCTRLVQRPATQPYPVPRSQRFASFYTWQEQNIVVSCERTPEDPRILHSLTLDVDEYGNVLQAAQVAYPRQLPSPLPPGLPEHVADVQSMMLITCTETEHTNDAIDIDHYRLRLPKEARSYELHNSTLTTPLWLPADLKEDLDTATEIDYSDTSGSLAKRILNCVRNFYAYNATPNIRMDFGDLESLALPHEHYTLAFTQTILDVSSGGHIDGTILEEGGYKELDSDRYWVPSGRVQYSGSPTSDFYTPVSYTDPWGNTTLITMWDGLSAGYSTNYYLLPQQTEDAAANITTVMTYDWRCLQPASIRDINDNYSDILYDDLCLPVAMAVKGKGSEGDYLEFIGGSALDPESDISTQVAFWSTPDDYAADLLGKASWRCIYDLDTSYDSPLTFSPVRVAMLARELHYQYCYDNSVDTNILKRITYTDGFGRVAMHKVQAGVPESPPGDENWIGSGKTVYNNKGKAVMQYEPYFSTTHAYDPATQADNQGVSPRMYYDPLGRVFRTEMPDGTTTFTIWDNWKQAVYDANDALGTWSGGEVASGTFTSSSQWYDDCMASSDSLRIDAATKAKQHADTPTIMHLDTLARPFYTVQKNRLPDIDEVWQPWNIESYADLDVLGNRMAVTDGRGLETMNFSYNMLKAPIMQNSVDSNHQYIVADVSGQPYYRWDEENRETNILYDNLRRPYNKTSGFGSVPKLLEVMIYGEAMGTSYNWRGKIFQSYDGAGLSTISSYDFKGNPLIVDREFASEYIEHPDWASPPSATLEGIQYTTTTVYDAFSRPLLITTPDGAGTVYIYDRSGMLYSVILNDTLSSPPGSTHDIVLATRYNARGQRTYVQYGNNTSTVFTYDPNTFRLTTLRTLRNISMTETVLQELTYYYDAVGNITHIVDKVAEDTYFANGVASPDRDYTYDALYRLIEATGREHVGDSVNPPDYNDSQRSRFSDMPYTNISALQTYAQLYTYDEVGNMLELQHLGAVSGSYTRHFELHTYTGSYVDNRLYRSWIGSATPGETYTYDLRGNMIGGMGHLDSMLYNDLNRLEKVVMADTNIISYYQYDMNGQRVRKVTYNGHTSSIQTRKYVGSWEEYTDSWDGTERETLHISDGTSNIALLETPVVGVGSQVLRYQYSDHLGSCTLECDINGYIVSYEEYHPFGTTSFQTGRSADDISLKRYRYIGKERDEETGFYYMGARYYCPWLCRWGAVDPILSDWYNFTHGEPDRLVKMQHVELTASSYEYCYDNPVRFVDPTGEQPPQTGSTIVTIINGPDGKPLPNGSTVGFSDKNTGTGLGLHANAANLKKGSVTAGTTVEFQATGGAAMITTTLTYGYGTGENKNKLTLQGWSQTDDTMTPSGNAPLKPTPIQDVPQADKQYKYGVQTTAVTPASKTLTPDNSIGGFAEVQTFNHTNPSSMDGLISRYANAAKGKVDHAKVVFRILMDKTEKDSTNTSGETYMNNLVSYAKKELTDLGFKYLTFDLGYKQSDEFFVINSNGKSISGWDVTKQQVRQEINASGNPIAPLEFVPGSKSNTSFIWDVVTAPKVGKILWRK